MTKYIYDPEFDEPGTYITYSDGTKKLTSVYDGGNQANPIKSAIVDEHCYFNLILHWEYGPGGVYSKDASIGKYKLAKPINDSVSGGDFLKSLESYRNEILSNFSDEPVLEAYRDEPSNLVFPCVDNAIVITVVEDSVQIPVYKRTVVLPSTDKPDIVRMAKLADNAIVNDGNIILPVVEGNVIIPCVAATPWTLPVNDDKLVLPVKNGSYINVFSEDAVIEAGKLLNDIRLTKLERDYSVYVKKEGRDTTDEYEHTAILKQSMALSKGSKRNGWKTLLQNIAEEISKIEGIDKGNTKDWCNWLTNQKGWAVYERILWSGNKQLPKKIVNADFVKTLNYPDWIGEENHFVPSYLSFFNNDTNIAGFCYILFLLATDSGFQKKFTDYAYAYKDNEPKRKKEPKKHKRQGFSKDEMRRLRMKLRAANIDSYLNIKALESKKGKSLNSQEKIVCCIASFEQTLKKISKWERKYEKLANFFDLRISNIKAKVLKHVNIDGMHFENVIISKRIEAIDANLTEIERILGTQAPEDVSIDNYSYEQKSLYKSLDELAELLRPGQDVTCRKKDIEILYEKVRKTYEDLIKRLPDEKTD